LRTAKVKDGEIAASTACRTSATLSGDQVEPKACFAVDRRIEQAQEERQGRIVSRLAALGEQGEVIVQELLEKCQGGLLLQ